MSNSYHPAKKYASFADLLGDSSEKADAIIKAMNNKIDPARLVTCSNLSDGSTPVLDISSIVDQILDMSRLPPNLSPFSQTLGCTETTFAGTAYPRTDITIDNVPYHVKLHQLKCRLENGARPKSIGEKKGIRGHMATASHICQNAKCINGKHLRWESLRDNMGRCGCFGYVMLKKGNLFKFVESEKCRHKVRCNNFIRVTLKD